MKESKPVVEDEKPTKPSHQEEEKPQDHVVPETQEEHDAHQPKHDAHQLKRQQSSDTSEGVDFSVVQNRVDKPVAQPVFVSKDQDEAKPIVEDEAKPKSKAKPKKIQPKASKKVSCLCYTEQHNVSIFFMLVYGLYVLLCFSGTKVD